MIFIICIVISFLHQIFFHLWITLTGGIALFRSGCSYTNRGRGLYTHPLLHEYNIAVTPGPPSKRCSDTKGATRLQPPEDPKQTPQETMSGRITPVFNNNNKFTADQIMTEASKLLHTIHKALDLLLELLLLAFHILTCQVETGYRWLVSRPRKDVQGKTVIITGSASGIGRQIAIKFGALGCRVILWDINEVSDDLYLRYCSLLI